MALSPAIKLVHDAWKRILQPGDVAIDATCGRGKDTVMLAGLVDARRAISPGKVIAFDVNEMAMKWTHSRLYESGVDMKNVLLLNTGHQHMLREAEQRPEWFTNVKLVTFNLGFLVGAKSRHCTTSPTTLAAIKAASKIVVPGGAISIVRYPHEEGIRELWDINNWWNDELSRTGEWALDPSTELEVPRTILRASPTIFNRLRL